MLYRTLFAMFFTLQFIPAFATPQSVDDSACAYYGEEIASFATCEGGHVAKSAPEAAPAPALPAANKSHSAAATNKAAPHKKHASAKDGQQSDAQRIVPPANIAPDAEK